METLKSIYEVTWFILLVAAGVAVLIGYLYSHFKFYSRSWFFPAVLAIFPVLALAIFGGLAGGYTFKLWLYFLMAEAAIAAFFRFAVKGRHTVPYLMLSPAFVGLALLLVYPLSSRSTFLSTT